MENFVNKIQEEVGVFDKEYLRKIQADMFRCSANCCDNTASSQNELQRCLENCAAPAQKADRFIEEQMKDIQERFQRCVMSCADKIKDKSSFGDNSAQNNKIEMEGCVSKCSEEMIKILPTFSKKIREYFNKQYYLK